MDARHLEVRGHLESTPVSAADDRDGITARFRVIVSPTDDPTDAAVLPCRTDDPAMAGALLTDMRPGDLLSLHGVFLQHADTGGLQLHVHAIDVLAPSAPTTQPEPVAGSPLPTAERTRGGLHLVRSP